MRKFAKISAVLAAMVLALAFVGCKDDDDDDDDDDPSVVTTWYCTETDEDDGSVKAELGGETYSGSYSGDTTKDGDIIVIIDTKYEITITDGKFHFNGGDYIKK